MAGNLSDEKISVQFGTETSELKSGLDDAVNSVSKAVGDMKSDLTALVPEIAAIGGAWFTASKSIAATTQMTEEAHKLGLSLGTTAEEASVLKVALDSIGVSTSTYETAAFRLSMQLKTNAEHLRSLSPELANAIDQHRSLDEIMRVAVQTLMQYKEGYDRNAASIDIFKRGAKEMQDLQRLNNDVMLHAKETAEAYGLVIGSDDVDAMYRYKSSMSDMHEFILALKKTIGEALMPLLTDLADWFKTIAPTALEIFKASVNAVVIGLQELKLMFLTIWDVGETTAKTLVISWQTFGKVMNDVLHGQFGQAVTDAKDGWNQIKTVATDTLMDIQTQTARTEEELEKLFGLMAKPPPKPPGGTKEYGAGYTLEELMAFLSDQQDLYKKEHAAELKMKEESIKAQEKLALEDLDFTKENLSFKRSMGEISAAEEKTALQTLEDEKYAIELKALQDKLDLQDEGTLEYQKTNDEIEELEKKHQLKMLELQHQTTLAIKADYDKLFSGITSAFDTSITGMIMGTTTLQKAMQKITQSILAEFVSMGVKKLTHWLSTELAMTAATQAGASARGSSEFAALMKGIATRVANAISSITTDAGKAGAAAYASTAEIPIIGPELAPGAAAAAIATVQSMVGFVAFEKGGNVPADMFAMLHKDEMVLPAGLANRVRGMPDEGGGAIHFTYNPVINAIDRRGVETVLKQHGDVIGDILLNQMRKMRTGINKL